MPRTLSYKIKIKHTNLTKKGDSKWSTQSKLKKKKKNGETNEFKEKI